MTQRSGFTGKRSPTRALLVTLEQPRQRRIIEVPKALIAGVTCAATVIMCGPAASARVAASSPIA